MALQRINAIVPVPLLRALSDAAPFPLPAAGETLQVALDRVAGDELFGTLAEGAPLRLLGMSAIAAGLQRGDELLLRVVSTTPRLELQLIEARSKTREDGAPRAGMGDDLAALRPDPAALRTLVRRPLDAVAISQAWQAHVSTPDAPPGAAADDVAAATSSMPTLAAVPWRWLVPMDALGASGVLRLVEGVEDDRTRLRPRRGLGLRLEFTLVAIGAVVLQVQPAAGGLVLTVGVDGEPAWHVVRQVLPEVEAALTTLGMRVASRRLERTLAAARRAPTAAPAAGKLPPSVIFRAAAEAALALAAAVSPPGFASSPGLDPAR
jgi:hypothetical protein